MSIQLREFTSAGAPPPSAAPASAFPVLPPEPTSIPETGLGLGFLTDLILKIVYFYGNITGQQLSEATKLPYLGVLDKVLEFLKPEHYYSEAHRRIFEACIELLTTQDITHHDIRVNGDVDQRVCSVEG